MITIIDRGKRIDIHYAEPLFISSDREIIFSFPTYPAEAEDYLFKSKSCDIQIKDTVFYGCEFDSHKKVYQRYEVAQNDTKPLEVVMRFTFDHTNGKGWVF